MRSRPRKLLIALIGLSLLGFLIYRSRGFLHLANFSGAKLLHALRGANPYLLALSVAAIYGCYALRALRWQVFQQNLGRARFGAIYRSTLAGFAAIFLFGRAGEPVRPLLLARRAKLPVADMFGIYVLERLFDTASAVVIAAIGLLLFQTDTHPGEISAALQTAARTTGSLLSAGVAGVTAILVYLRLHGSAALERRLQGWLAGPGWRKGFARIVLGFVRGVQTIRTWGELLMAALYSAAHWLLVVAIYFWVSHAFGGVFATISLGDAMLLLATTLVGSAAQVPLAGGGSQLAAILVYTAVFGIEMEPATAAAIVLWLITFAACSLAGVPLLIHEGFSVGELRRMTEREKEITAASGG